MTTITKSDHRAARKRRIRAKISGTKECPRLTVFRSLTQITAQLVDDVTGKTLAFASTKELKLKPNTEGATKLGEELFKKAKTAKITTVVFDRNGYRYHGRIKAFADAARTAGLSF